MSKKYDAWGIRNPRRDNSAIWPDSIRRTMVSCIADWVKLWHYRWSDEKRDGWECVR